MFRLHSKLTRKSRRWFATSAATEEQLLREEAKALTLKLYRACVRSVRHIRHGNALDEAEFQRREEERLDLLYDDSSTIKRNPMLSMLPPVDRQDELRSRAEYYLQYARDYFQQEAGCLDGEQWFQQRVARYVYSLHRGEHQRKWLLQDMGFDDPFSGLDEIRLELFQKNAQALAAQQDVATDESNASTTKVENRDREDDNAYAWSDDEEEGDERHLPGLNTNAKSGGGV
ncbi:hypothetical protein FisN_14Lh193 [Fistulifera solaris]|uniref:Uncharacterized protein n=1 Tax=Fistulifera solaris TaxID=1519565 RepID=A0A1Z5J9W8_FISSO|nr:hypothetical protein FisN_14Lh193 [Fistulifera solaris]|eukprot:GAX10682.1 hypothetical protein FisN_14Lh193 [Fistulifera solaris]